MNPFFTRLLEDLEVSRPEATVGPRRPASTLQQFIASKRVKVDICDQQDCEPLDLSTKENPSQDPVTGSEISYPHILCNRFRPLLEGGSSGTRSGTPSRKMQEGKYTNHNPKDSIRTATRQMLSAKVAQASRPIISSMDFETDEACTKALEFPIHGVDGQQLPVAADLIASVDLFWDDTTSTTPKRKRDEMSPQSMLEQMEDRRYRSYQVGQWHERFRELCQYKMREGHCQVPHKYQANLPLARWVKRQRYQYKLMKEGQPSTLSQERIKMLSDIGFVFDFQGEAWEEKIADLQEFRRKHSHADVPCNYEENTRLAVWVKCQRRQYKLYVDGKPSSMTPERINELESLGFKWGIRKSSKKRRIE